MCTEKCKGVQRDREEYIGVQSGIEVYKGITEEYKGLQRCTEVYGGVQLEVQRVQRN